MVNELMDSLAAPSTENAVHLRHRELVAGVYEKRESVNLGTLVEKFHCATVAKVNEDSLGGEERWFPGHSVEEEEQQQGRPFNLAEVDFRTLAKDELPRKVRLFEVSRCFIGRWRRNGSRG